MPGTSQDFIRLGCVVWFELLKFIYDFLKFRKLIFHIFLDKRPRLIISFRQFSLCKIVLFLSWMNIDEYRISLLIIELKCNILDFVIAWQQKCSKLFFWRHAHKGSDDKKLDYQIEEKKRNHTNMNTSFVLDTPKWNFAKVI